MVFLGKKPDYSDMSSVSSIVTSSDEEDTDIETDHMYGQLRLPWDENYWNIKVSHVVSPNEVWATLTKNADLLSRTDRITALASLKVAECIIAGEIYIWKSADTVHRVRAVKCYWIESRPFWDCFFIDIGKFETIAYDELCECVDAYRNIAPQAICFKLFGFDELNHCPHIDSSIRAWLVNKQFVGCLMMAESQYQVQLNHGIKMPKVSIALFIFYPKFTLYKPLLLKRIGDTLPKPTFSHGICNAKVSHVTPMGLVYFNLDEHSSHYIDTLIQRMVSENQQLTCRSHHSVTTNCVVLIYDCERNMYHRGKIMAVEVGSPTKYKCHYMDKGDTQSVALSNIYALNDTSILSYYPAQAVPAKLHLVPTLEDTACKRLTDILTDAKVQVRVIDQKATFPTVIVHKDSMNINNLIRMEYELYKFAIHAELPDSMI